jgi:hypothetical protein
LSASGWLHGKKGQQGRKKLSKQQSSSEVRMSDICGTHNSLAVEQQVSLDVTFAASRA